MNKKFNNKSDVYPIVLLPQKILANVVNGIEEDIIKNKSDLKEPRKRKVYPPEKPSKFKKISFEKLNFWQLGCLIYSLIICSIVAVIFWLLPESNLSEAFFVFAFLVVLSLIMGSINDGVTVFPETTLEYKEVEKTAEEYEQELSEYDSKLIDYEKNIEQAEREYSQEVVVYKKFFNQQKIKIAKSIHYKSLNPHKKARRIFYPQKRGAAEIKFLETARETLRDYIFLDMGIDQNVYYPDLTLICPETNLHIDIEIDEPYKILDKSPIHCLGDDEKRNTYFLEHNWCVIRFAEEQVVTQPEETVHTLVSILKSIIKMQSSYTSSLKRIKTWDYEDAVIMANKNHRQNYLKKASLI